MAVSVLRQGPHPTAGRGSGECDSQLDDVKAIDWEG